MFRQRVFSWMSAAAFVTVATLAQAQQAPDALIKEVSTDVLDAVKADKTLKAGDTNKVMTLVESKVMPHVNFQRMTAASVGPGWRKATPEQKAKLQDEFKTLLVRTYAGALSQVSADQTVQLEPLRGDANAKEVVVQSKIRGRGEPISLNYRLEKSDTGWRIYDVNVAGMWLVENYRGQFPQTVNASGIDGLIAKLAEQNKAAATRN